MRVEPLQTHCHPFPPTDLGFNHTSTLQRRQSINNNGSSNAQEPQKTPHSPFTPVQNAGFASVSPGSGRFLLTSAAETGGSCWTGEEFCRLNSVFAPSRSPEAGGSGENTQAGSFR